MKKMLRTWFWGFMGYDSGPPVNNADLNRILQDWHARIAEDSRKQSAESQARLFEYWNKFLAQQESSDNIVNVRIVK